MSSETIPASKEPNAEGKKKSGYQPLRIWPVVVLLAMMLTARYLPSMIQDGPPTIWMLAAFGPLLCSLVISLWWISFSRATWVERILGIVGLIAGLIVTAILVHPSMLGPVMMVVTIPMGAATFSIATILLSRKLTLQRTLLAVAIGVLGFGFSGLLKSDGMWGNFAFNLHWRWTETAEERFLAAKANQSNAPVAEDSDIFADLDNPQWPAFRGYDRSGRQVDSPVLSSDWNANPPKELWRIAVGPAWSSFAVAGKVMFTQEQRGEFEATVCYESDTGNEVWANRIESRFDDPLGGPGPRATPAIAAGAVFSMGPSGFLSRINARNGKTDWKVDLKEVAKRQPPMWGFSSSPLVVNNSVIVHAGGEDKKGTLAFDIDTGNLKWGAEAGDHSYSSAQLATIDGKEFVLVLTNTGMNFLDPDTGEAMFDYPWDFQGYRVCQPQVLDDESILIPTGLGAGTRRIVLSQSDGKLTAEELWTSRYMKPDFNDFVVYDENIYGFDGSIFGSISLKDGKKNWRRGRYGKGQATLVSNQGLIIVVSETGDLVLLKADPKSHQELFSIKAMRGKTWNHPVVVGNRLYIRNAEEAICYELPLAETSSKAPSKTPAENLENDPEKGPAKEADDSGQSAESDGDK